MTNTYIFNPDYHLFNDKYRTLLFTKSTVWNESDKGCFIIHPVQAMILSFFTVDRSLYENLEVLSRFLDKTKEAVYELIKPFIENQEPMKVCWQGTDLYFPRNILLRKQNNHNPNRKAITLQELKCNGKIDLETERVFTAPSKITFMLTNKCITHCIYCYADKKHCITNNLSTSRILDIIREASHLNVAEIDLIGGEIFLHPDWQIILSEVVKYEMDPIILSTKIPITEQIAEGIRASCYKGVIQISLDSASETVLKKTLLVSDGYLEKVRAGLRWLEYYQIPFQVATILTRYNADKGQMSELASLLSSFSCCKKWDVRVAINSLHIDSKTFSAIKSDYDTLQSLYEYIKTEIQPLVSYSIEFGNELMDRIFYRGKVGETFGLKCSALLSQLFILPDGKVTICEQLYWDKRFIIGDVTNSSIETVWNSPQAISLLNYRTEQLQDKSPCKSCGFWNDCNGHFRRCWVDVQKAYGKENWDYPDPRCEAAPSMGVNIGYKQIGI